MRSNPPFGTALSPSTGFIRSLVGPRSPLVKVGDKKLRNKMGAQHGAVPGPPAIGDSEVIINQERAAICHALAKLDLPEFSAVVAWTSAGKWYDAGLQSQLTAIGTLEVSVQPIMPKPPKIVESLVRLHGRRRLLRLRQKQQFRLRSLLMFVTVVAIVSASIGVWGTAAWNHVEIRWQQFFSRLPTMEVDNIVAIPCTLAAMVLGATVFAVVYRRKSNSAYLMFSILVCLSLILLTTGLSLNPKPLAKTELRQLQLDQLARIVLLLIGCVVPVSAFLGWYCSAAVEPGS